MGEYSGCFKIIWGVKPLDNCVNVEDAIIKILFLKDKVEEYRIGVEDHCLHEYISNLEDKKNELQIAKNRFKELTNLDYDAFIGMKIRNNS